MHARAVALMDRYTHHLSEMLQIDRTPLPYSYVQMAATLLVGFCCTMPFALVAQFGAGTPVTAAIIGYAYAGLYINSCTLRNPFNYEGTLTGIPINAFLKRLQRITETLLLDCANEYRQAVQPGK